MGRPNLTKALALPAPGRTDLSGPARALALQSYLYNGSTGKVLPRPDDVFTTNAFSPFKPTQPFQIDPSRPPSDAAPPRIWQYPVGWNLPTGPRGMEPVSFEILEQLAERVDIIRIAIEVVKKEVARAQWEITLKDTSQFKAKGKDYKQNERDQLKAFFEQPDPIAGLFYDEWVSEILEEVLVKDALTIYPRPTKVKGKGILGSSISALQVIDGKTIKPLLDWAGSRPLPPAPAFQQFIWGVPRSEFVTATDFVEGSGDKPDATFTAQELIYKPFNPRAKTIWGFPPVEWSLINIITYMRRGLWWQGYFDSSNIPQGFMFGPEGWTPDELERYERSLNAMMAGDPTWQFSIKFIPNGGKYEPVKQPTFDITFDEYMIKLLLMPFGVSPQEVGLSPKGGLGGKGQAEEQKEAGERRSVEPYLSRLSNINTWIINHYFNQPELKFSYVELEIEDQAVRATIDKSYVDSGVRTRNEVREDNGWDAIDEPVANLLTVTTAGGISPLSQFDPKVLQQQQEQQAQQSQHSAEQQHQQGMETQQSQQEHEVNLERIRQAASKNQATASKAALVELDAFDRFAAKGPRARPFEFKALEPDTAAMLNDMLVKRGPIPAKVKAVQAKAAAELRVNAHKLADGDDGYGKADFVTDGKALLKSAVHEAFLIGARGSLTKAAVRKSLADQARERANAVAAEQERYLDGFADDIDAGMTPDAISNRSDAYTGAVWGGYNRGALAAAQDDFPDGSAIWHTSDDPGVCPNCNDLDNQSFSFETIPSFPGEGDFGDNVTCQGGPMCRCWLEYVDAGTGNDDAADVAAAATADLTKFNENHDEHGRFSESDSGGDKRLDWANLEKVDRLAPIKGSPNPGWLSPDGQLYRIKDGEAHTNSVDASLGKGSDPMSAAEDVMNSLYKDGWVRVSNFDDPYQGPARYAEGGTPERAKAGLEKVLADSPVPLREQMNVTANWAVPTKLGGRYWYGSVKDWNEGKGRTGWKLPNGPGDQEKGILADLTKFNQNHDEHGRFSSGDGSGAGETGQTEPAAFNMMHVGVEHTYRPDMSGETHGIQTNVWEVKGDGNPGISPEENAVYHQLEDDLRGRATESALVQDKNGTIYRASSASSDSVAPTPQLLKAMDGGRFTHNHPTTGASPLSPPDITIGIMAGATEIRAVTPKETFTVTPPDGGWQNVKKYDALMTNLQSPRLNYFLVLRATSNQEIASTLHTSWQEMSKVHGFGYSAEKFTGKLKTTYEPEPNRHPDMADPNKATRQRGRAMIVKAAPVVFDPTFNSEEDVAAYYRALAAMVAASKSADLTKEIEFSQTDAIPDELPMAPLDVGERETHPAPKKKKKKDEEETND